MEFAPIQPHQDAAMAAIVRAALKEHGLDKPGTAYFDASLDHRAAEAVPGPRAPGPGSRQPHDPLHRGPGPGVGLSADLSRDPHGTAGGPPRLRALRLPLHPPPLLRHPHHHGSILPEGTVIFYFVLFDHLSFDTIRFRTCPRETCRAFSCGGRECLQTFCCGTIKYSLFAFCVAVL